MNRIRTRSILGLAVCALAFVSITAQAAGVDVVGFVAAHPNLFATLGLMGMVGEIDLKTVTQQLDKIETNLKAMSDKAEGEMKTLGKVSEDTKTALDRLGTSQREFADRLTQLEQKGLVTPEPKLVETWGSQVVKSDSLKAFQNGGAQKARIEVKNTLVGSDATVAPDRRVGIVAGAAQMLTMESFLNSLPTSSNAIEFTKESSFTNNAGETAEGVAKPESAITFALVNMPISTVAHWIKISRQLAADNAALAAYVNNRMRYGVNRKVETQLVTGDGVAPNISGIFDAGNFTAHGIADAALGTVLKKVVLIRKVMAASWAAGYPADAVLLNPIDWAEIEIELLVTPGGQSRVSVDEAGVTRLFGIPVIQSVGVAADTFAVGAFGQAYTVYNREGVTVELSESDADNFTKNLVTIRAERRLALATEVPAAVRGGDLTPA
ncbi:phage major capsid protein [Variovorax sp. EBFNA2]|uniref:phage major capsid protein n=1 Tax=Variovorax sp. EBFNA2 TaxID=3342097 RepID=UPI0029C04E82|nr:phage major capsid protein [Variovorax boronicumulans]WPG35139.1 phage major capsid protein [Variovorax boronicumulans]